MKVLFILSVLSLGFATQAAYAATTQEEALKQVPAADLQGMKVTGCEEKGGTYRVSCGKGGKCSISITPTRFTCKALRT